MPILYKAITAVLAATGCISLLITGELNLLICMGGLSIFPGYYRFFKGYPHASKRVAAVLSQATLVLFLSDAFFISGDIFLAVAHMTIIFQGIKSFDLKEPWDHLQVYFMALLQLIIASEMTRALAFGVVFVVFMVLLVTAMVLSHFLKEGALGRVSLRRPVFATVLLTLVCTVLFFVILPRSPQRFFGRSHYQGIRTVGFSDRVSFGSFGEIKLDPTVVMRIEMAKEPAEPLYWRGIALDYFDGSSWSNSSRSRQRVSKTADEFRINDYEGPAVIEQRIFLEPLDSDVIFGLSRISAVRADLYSIYADDEMGVFMPGRSSRRTSYAVYSDIMSGQAGKPESRYLQMPENMDRIADLAVSIVEKETSAPGKAGMIEQYLKQNYKYALSTTQPPAGMSVIEDFLFRTKKGYCEHYSTSMVLMLRSLGIPARVVNGFYGGEKNEFGNYFIVRQSNAHAWVEALVDGQWRRFDPTPAVSVRQQTAFSLLLDSIRMQWTRYVVGFSTEDQKEILRGIAAPFRIKGWSGLRLAYIWKFLALMLAVSAACSMFYLFLGLLKKRRRYGHVTGTYLKFKNILAKRGIKLTESMTAGELLTAVRGSSVEKEAKEFLSLYEGHRFGLRQMTDIESVRFKALLLRIKSAK